MNKHGNEAYERFVLSDVVRKLKESRMPEVEKAWGSLPLGYRAMIYRQAGLLPSRADEGLKGLSQDERRSLQAANLRISELQTIAARALVGAVHFKPRG